ncbi:MAG: hypothetical protein ACD_79C00466G0014 [uncultured bacterium]|nr:MAG: hypothetical protein ACD_79C00466G0014 [uncultured bacterium]
MRKLKIVIALSLAFILSGCLDYVKKQDYQVLEASVTRRLNKLNSDLNVTKGAVSENRAAIEVLQEQVDEISKKLGIINNDVKAVSNIETDFNKKLNSMMKEVVKENERLIQEINKTRAASTSSASSSSGKVNIYNKTENKNLDTGYYHTVEAGESLSKIAIKYQVPIDDIIKANEMADPNNLYSGQKIFIPDPGTGIDTTASNTAETAVSEGSQEQK